MKLLRLPFDEAAAWPGALFGCLPGRAGIKARALWHRLRVRSLGRKPQFERGFVLTGPADVSLGDSFSADLGSAIMIGPNTVVRASKHEHADAGRPIRQQGHRPGRIVLEDGVWVAANAVILPDVRVGRHSIVAASGVVTKDVPAYSIVGGVSAKVLPDRRAAA